MNPTYYDLGVLLSDNQHPLDEIRANAIAQAFACNKDFVAEPMTIIVKDYIGGGDLRYSFPNEGKVPNLSSDGYLHSVWKDRQTWRFFKEPLREMGLMGGTVHLLCIRFRPEDSKKKDLFPVCIVEYLPEGSTPQGFSRRNARAHQEGQQEYLTYCVERNQEWLA